MHDERRLIEARLKREYVERIRPAIHGPRLLMTASHRQLDGEPEPYTSAMSGGWTPIEPGTPWGRPWGTTWFRLTATVPDNWAPGPVDVIVELGFSGAGPGFQAEGLVYVDGEPVSGLHPKRRTYRLPDARPGSAVDIVVEAASNPDFNASHRPSLLGSSRTAGDRPLYVFGGGYLAVRFDEVQALTRDLEVLGRLTTALPDGDARRHRLTLAVERALNALDLGDIHGTTATARAILAPTLKVPARSDSHRVFAIGHAHIDTAWLWPIRETVRKVTRTFSNVIDLMDEYPEFRFGCSQAVQYQWIEDRHPALFERIKEKVADGQWIPIGGQWVEADMNLPSGESLVRQLIHGQRYFESRFAKRCTEVWIPDVFGYPGSLPQIFAAAGCDNFVTQKLSWNKQNRMPHNTFWWEGIDGTRVLTHFPPVDTYNAEMQPDQLIYAAGNFADKAWSNVSIMPFGHGDGGGGPTREMLERARLMVDLDGVPRVEQRAPADFFDVVRAEAHHADVPLWRGELYFEMHRGTLTSQTKTKVGNVRCERLLREAELWWATVGPGPRTTRVTEELDGLWKEVLVQQFHDILPGSSIAWVHEDAERVLTSVAERLDKLVAEALSLLGGGALLANAATGPRDEVVISDVPPPPPMTAQALPDGRYAYRARVAGLSVVRPVAVRNDDSVVVTDRSLENAAVRMELDDSGRISSLLDKRCDRQLLRSGEVGANLTIAPDHPVEYDAWDLERWTARRAVPIDTHDAIEVVASGPLVGSISVPRSFGDSSITTTYLLTAGSARLEMTFEIDWHEDEKLLAIDFPLDIHTEQAKCGIQFGHVARPTHRNTSWDLAKFEVCAHRWVDVSEPSFGVAVLNDTRFGHALQDGGVRVTLLRAAQYPDPRADRGHHTCRLAIFPHGPGLSEVVTEAERFTLPVRSFPGTPGSTPTSVASSLVSVDGVGVEVSAVKLADDESGDLIVRLFEACGDRAALQISMCGPIINAWRTNLLEEPVDQIELVNGAVVATLRPFEMMTVRLAAETQ